MSKGLFHCSRCKKHFYDGEATQMHIKDTHKGKGEVLRHPTKRELLIQSDLANARITELEAALEKVTRTQSLAFAQRTAIAALKDTPNDQ